MPSTRNTRILWGEAETDMLVEERRRRNDEYHYVYRGNKEGFWEVWREEFADDSAADILVVSAKISSGI